MNKTLSCIWTHCRYFNEQAASLERRVGAKKESGSTKTGIFSQTGFASDVRLGAHFGAILGSLFPSLSSAQFRAREFRATCFTYKGSAQFRAPWERRNERPRKKKWKRAKDTGKQFFVLFLWVFWDAQQQNNHNNNNNQTTTNQRPKTTKQQQQQQRQNNNQQQRQNRQPQPENNNNRQQS